MNLNKNKMQVLKIMVLMKFLKRKEVEKLYECCYEFDVEDDFITRLHIWNNPKGNHNYEEKYHKTFKMKNVPVKTIFD
jgi:hypothetical protein